MIEISVEGVPQPAGSKRGFTGKDGRVLIVDDCAGSRAWKNRVATLAMLRMRALGLEPTRLPVFLTLSFYAARPKCHLGAKGNVLPSAPPFPVVKPDLTKLIRACEDALTGVIWLDDAQVVQQVSEKLYGPRPGVVIQVEVWLEGRWQ